MPQKLEDRLNLLAVRVATEFNAKNAQTGNLGDLNTTASTLVAAINEVLANTPEGVMLLANNLSDLESAVVSRTNLGVQSVAESDAAISTAIAAITLGSLGGLNQAEVDVRVQAIVGAAPAALDTLVEFGNAIGNDADFAATITTALSNKVSFNVVQSLTDAQQLQACQNIGIGNPDQDLVSVFEGALTP